MVADDFGTLENEDIDLPVQGLKIDPLSKHKGTVRAKSSAMRCQNRSKALFKSKSMRNHESQTRIDPADMGLYGGGRLDPMRCIPTAISGEDEDELVQVNRYLRRGVTPQAQTSHLIINKQKRPSLHPS